MNENILNRIFGKKEKKTYHDKLRDKHKAMSDTELKTHAAELKSQIPSARAGGSLVGGAVHDAWRSAQNEIDRRARVKTVEEEAPANAVGAGKIAGMGVGPQGEPGVKAGPMARYKRKNAAEAPKVGRKTFTMFMQGK